jgi:hypothetical protein
VETDDQDAKYTGGWRLIETMAPCAQRIQVTVGNPPSPRRTVSHGHTIARGCKPPAQEPFFLNSTQQRRVGPGPRGGWRAGERAEGHGDASGNPDSIDNHRPRQQPPTHSTTQLATSTRLQRLRHSDVSTPFTDPLFHSLFPAPTPAQSHFAHRHHSCSSNVRVISQLGTDRPRCRLSPRSSTHPS